MRIALSPVAGLSRLEVLLRRRAGHSETGCRSRRSLIAATRDEVSETAPETSPVRMSVGSIG